MSCVSWETWTNVWTLPCMPLTRPSSSKPIILTQWALSPRRPEQMSRDFPISSLKDNLPSNTIISTQLALSPRRPEQMCRDFAMSPMNNHFWAIFEYNSTIMRSVSHETRMCRGFPVCPLQDSFPSKSIILTLHELCLLEDLNKCAEASLCHQQTAFFKSSFWVQLYWLNDLCLPGDVNECA